MAIQMKLSKENNHLYFDFPEAYWVVEMLGFRIDRYKKDAAGFTFSAFPSKEAREAYKKTYQTESIINKSGEPEIPYVSPRLYSWTYEGTLSELFPNGVPYTKEEQLAAVYDIVKKKWNLKEGEYINC